MSWPLQWPYRWAPTVAGSSASIPTFGALKTKRQGSLGSRQLPIDRSIALTRGISCVDLVTTDVVNAVTGQLGSITGTRQVGTSRGIARGFGATFGSGSSDRIQTAYTGNSAQRTIAIRMLRNGNGPSSFGMAVAKSSGSSQIELLYVFAGSTFAYLRKRASVDTDYRWPLPAIGVPTVVTLTYDSSNTANAPLMYYNGVLQTPSTTTGGSGATTDNSDPYQIGNRADGARSWDGWLAEFAVWDRILSPDEVRALNDGPRQLFAPDQLPIWSSGSSTVVSAALAANYAIGGTTQQDLAATYSVLTAAQQDLAATYAIQAAAQQDLASTYDVLNAAQQDIAASYDIITAVTSDSSAAYAIQSAVSSDLTGNYTMTVGVEADLASTYAIQNSAQADLGAAYDLAGAVTSDLSAAYTVSTTAQSDLAAAYTVLTAAQADLSPAYGIAGTVQSDLSPSYAIAGTVSADLPATYEILTGNVVTSDFAAAYTVSTTVTTDSAQAYSVLAAAQADLTPTYTVINAAQADLTPSYAIQNGVEADLSAGYAVQAAAMRDLTGAWSITAGVEADLTATYAVYAAGGGTGASPQEIAEAVWAHVLLSGKSANATLTNAERQAALAAALSA